MITDGMLQDEGYFAAIDGRKRIKIASHSYDLGEYLRELDRRGNFNRALGSGAGSNGLLRALSPQGAEHGATVGRAAQLVPGISIENVGGAFDCCGLSGIMGFKKEFHAISLAMGRPLDGQDQSLRPRDCS